MDKPYIEIDLIQNTLEWEEWRNEGIGASDAPAIMGENRFKSYKTLLYEKRNRIRPHKNAKMIQGSRWEEPARQSYSSRFEINLEPLCVQSKTYPWIRASLDGISKERDHLVEIKCGESAYKKANQGVVPDYYYGQLQHQLLITGLRTIDYWCYLPNNPGTRITIERDDRYIEKLLILEEQFYAELSELPPIKRTI